MDLSPSLIDVDKAVSLFVVPLKDVMDRKCRIDIVLGRIYSDITRSIGYVYRDRFPFRKFRS